MYPGVTEKFLDITLEAYRKHFGDEFGKGIPGRSRTSRRFGRRGGCPGRWICPSSSRPLGLQLIDNLPCLVRDTGDYKRVRHDYLYVCNQCSSSGGPSLTSSTARKNGLKFTGHYWEHEWPECLACPTTWPCTRGTNCPRSTT